jgi:eukaryotic-like serine/threonine-protein kinase
MSEMIDKTISHYRITEKLGEGGMGTVYKARDLKLDRHVALKFLPPHLSVEDSQKKRFINEAKAASSLDHPNIGTIYEINETADGDLYIVMACYEGQTLKNKLASGPLSIEEAISLTLQISQGMAKAHERGIVHRDLKPGNILITSNGIVKIIDFGLAKLTGEMHLTKTGSTIGTAAYMSPEQASGDDVDMKTDIWSLGVMLYEMLAGKLPFHAEYETAMMYLIVNEQHKPIHDIRNDVPIDLENIVNRALQKDSNQRYQRMEEICDILLSLQKDIELGLDISKRKSTLAIPIPHILQKRSWMFYIALCVVMTAIIVLAWKTIFTGNQLTAFDRSLAVLPFVVEGDLENEYLADGLAWDLTQHISRLRGVMVISKSTSFLYKKSILLDKTIAEALGVRYLIHGKIMVVGNRVQLVFFLFDSKFNQESWKKDYDKSRSEIFTVEDEISREIASELKVEYNLDKPLSLKTSPEAYDSYLHGYYYLSKEHIQESDNSLAIEYFNESCKKDSQFVPAIVALAHAKVNGFMNGWNQSAQVLADAEINCTKALRLDSNNANACSVKGMIVSLRGDKTGSHKWFEKSLEKDDHNILALTMLAYSYMFDLNEPAKSVIYLKKWQDIDPTDYSTYANIGIAYGQLKDYTEAIRCFRQSLKLSPYYAQSWTNLGYALERVVQYDSAIICYNTALRLDPKFEQAYENIIGVLLATGKYAKAESILVSGIKHLQTNSVLFYDLGVTYLQLGKRSLAQRAFKEGLSFVEGKLQKNKNIGQLQADFGLFKARLYNGAEAISGAAEAYRLDSTNSDIILKISCIYAVLGQKDKMLEWFKRAKAMNPEYDVPFLATAIDFEKYRNDPDLLFIAKQK